MRVAEATTAERARSVISAEPAAHQDIQPAELRLRRLTTKEEIGRVERLRRQIPLPAEVVSDPGFALLEKKGTRSASSRPWSGTHA